MASSEAQQLSVTSTTRDSTTRPSCYVGLGNGGSYSIGSASSASSRNCVTDGPNWHENNERCTIRVRADGLLSYFGEFSTGGSYLTINGQRYGGTNGPRRVAVSAGSSFTWYGDSSCRHPGFTICWMTGPPVARTRTTRAPTSPPPPDPQAPGMFLFPERSNLQFKSDGRMRPLMRTCMYARHVPRR